MTTVIYQVYKAKKQFSNFPAITKCWVTVTKVTYNKYPEAERRIVKKMALPFR